jgi:hypothetical protein
MSSNAAIEERTSFLFGEGENERIMGANGLSICFARTAPARAAALAYIQAQFQIHFGAQIVDDTPVLMVCTDEQGMIVAAWGLRTISDGLFSARYLERDLLDRLSDAYALPPLSDKVVELAHLCLSRPRILPDLVPLLAETLVQMGYHYLVCTATGCLIRYFERRGLTPLILAPANRDRLPLQDRGLWGSYYEHGPMVVAGSIDAALLGGRSG